MAASTINTHKKNMYNCSFVSWYFFNMHEICGLGMELKINGCIHNSFEIHCNTKQPFEKDGNQIYVWYVFAFDRHVMYSSGISCGKVFFRASLVVCL